MGLVPHYALMEMQFCFIKKCIKHFSSAPSLPLFWHYKRKAMEKLHLTFRTPDGTIWRIGLSWRVCVTETTL